MFGVQMNDLEGVLRDSPDDQEMQRMAEEEQQQLQQQVCVQALSAGPVLHHSSAESSDHNMSAICMWLVGMQSDYPVVLRHMPMFATGPWQICLVAAVQPLTSDMSLAMARAHASAGW